MSDEYGSMAAKPSTDDKEADTKESPSNDPAGAADGDKDEEIARLGPNYRRDPATNGLVYVDPQTKQEFVLNDDKTDWVPKSSSSVAGILRKYFVKCFTVSQFHVFILFCKVLQI